MPIMTFTCPYCNNTTKASFGSLLFKTYFGYAFGRTKCSKCGKEFLFRPMAMKMEDLPAWKNFKSELLLDNLKLIPVLAVLALSIILVFLAILRIARAANF